MSRPIRVEVRRVGPWWAIDVPAVPGAYSQAADLEHVEPMARDALALLLDVAADELAVDVRVVDGRPPQG